jgi:hypothetical protein
MLYVKVISSPVSFSCAENWKFPIVGKLILEKNKLSRKWFGEVYFNHNHAFFANITTVTTHWRSIKLQFHQPFATLSDLLSFTEYEFLLKRLIDWGGNYHQNTANSLQCNLAMIWGEWLSLCVYITMEVILAPWSLFTLFYTCAPTRSCGPSVESC